MPSPAPWPRTPGWQDTETSIEAAEAIAPALTRLQERVLEAIHLADWVPATDDEVDALLLLAYVTTNMPEGALAA